MRPVTRACRQMAIPSGAAIHLKEHPLRTVGFVFLMVILIASAGCAPDYLLIKKVDFHDLEGHVQEQRERLATITFQQEQTHRVMVDYSQSIFAQLNEIYQKQDQQDQRLRDIEEFVRKARLRRQRANEAESQEMIEKRNVSEYSDKQVIGAMERIFITPPGKMLPARIDTGAVTSSLDARNIERFERNGERWVRFSIINPENGEYSTLERRIIRNVRIVQSFSDEAERRPVVELGVTIGRITQTAQFTLSDRSHMEYPVLIGRNILMDVMIVDVSETNIAPPVPPLEPPNDVKGP